MRAGHYTFLDKGKLLKLWNGHASNEFWNRVGIVLLFFFYLCSNYKSINIIVLNTPKPKQIYMSVVTPLKIYYKNKYSPRNT